MKKTKRLWALLLAMVMALGLITTAFAAPTIDLGRKASLSVYKYDITAASADGAWDAATYVSTGVQDDAVTDKLAQYAIRGVEFTYLRVASISTYSQRESGQHKVGVLYGFADDAVLQAIGLGKADAYKSGGGVFYFTSDKLNKAMADTLADNATTVKNALETAVRNGGKAMPETDTNGHSKVSGLEQGLYLVVETRVPENVTSTCNPFFVSLPTFGLYLQRNNFNTVAVAPTVGWKDNGDGTKSATFEMKKADDMYTWRLSDATHVTRAGFLTQKDVVNDEHTFRLSFTDGVNPDNTQRLSHDRSSLGTTVKARDEADIQVNLDPSGYKVLDGETRLRAYRYWELIPNRHRRGAGVVCPDGERRYAEQHQGLADRGH